MTISDPTLRRTHTPPDLKWLLNERAMLTGSMYALRNRISREEREIARLQALLERQQQTVTAARAELASAEGARTGLDKSLALLYPQVSPSAGGVVYAWAGRYGEWGALTRFVLSLVQATAPEPVTCAELASLVIKEFGLNCPSSYTRNLQRYRVRTVLRKAALRGLVVRLPSTSHRDAGRWVWASDPSLSDLAALAEAAYAAEAEQSCERSDDGAPDNDRARGEVAGQ